MNNIIGFLNLHHSPQLGGLTMNRPMASTTFLGRYAFMDFTLSNFSNSGIDQVGILVKHQPRSILKHLGSRNTWNVNTKTGFEYIAYNDKAAFSDRYNHDFANIRYNMWILESSPAEYVVIAPSHFICSIDYREVLKEHIRNHAEITMVYQHVKNAREHFIGSDILSITKDGLVTGMRSNKGTSEEADISMETYIVNRKKLLEMMEEAANTSSFFGIHDLVAFHCGKSLRVHTYAYEGYLRCFDSLEHYVQYSFELLDYHLRQQLFRPNWPIYTVTHDTPPTEYKRSASVRNSFIANGAVIYGQVENSIISRQVVIERGASVKNCIIFTDSYIGSNVQLNCVVVDKYAKVHHVQVIEGTEERPLYIKQGDEV